MFDLLQIQQQLERAQLAGHIYRQDNILVLQAPYQDDGSALNVFAQHEHSGEQIGLQFAIQINEQHIDYLIGITLSNQDRLYEIAPGNLKGEQRAFNLIYAFYNFPKKFYLLKMPFTADTTEFNAVFEMQLFHRTELKFLDTALKTDPHGHNIPWIKDFMLRQALEMKVRIQLAIL
ncbi:MULTISPECIES: hypothetical protein [Acinetobacter]|uniref:Uncharacterized protein n=1 Tax=Acinetobacter piscicola TaxID=2006115 RepID=A0A7S7AHU9_9GAMM|nr:MULTISPECIES: hypothetical protein [Acinetobacter]QOW46760.1 hypothetical protein G0028_13110 [Acinetobacter piscicola]